MYWDRLRTRLKLLRPRFRFRLVRLRARDRVALEVRRDLLLGERGDHRLLAEVLHREGQVDAVAELRAGALAGYILSRNTPVM